MYMWPVVLKPRFYCLHNSKVQRCQTHLCEVQIHEAEREELQADWETVEQPERQGSQRVCCHAVPEIKGEEQRSKSRPQQTQEQKHRLVAEALVSVSQHQPELHVHERKEQRVEDGVGHRQPQLDEGRHGRAEGWQRRERVTLHSSAFLLLPGEGSLEGAFPPPSRGSAAPPSRVKITTALILLEKTSLWERPGV